tara:strand:- start:1903 stop:2283 length:381 start_codon:yes stop_codon:yes gene_type:complete
MAVATREKLFACTRRRYRTETIGGLDFTFQSLTEAEKSKFEKQVLNKQGSVKDDSRRRLLVLSLVDAKSKQPLLDDADIVELGNLDGAVTSQLFDIAMEHVGFSDNEIEELEKNSQKTTGGGSRSA